MEFSLEHRFAVSPKIYMDEVYFHPELGERLQKTLDLGIKKLIEEEDNDQILRRVHFVQPQKDLPRAAKKLFGQKGLGYYETTTYHKGNFFFDWSMKTEMMPERIHGGGKIQILEDGDHSILRVTGQITAKVFGIGGMIEKVSIESIQESYEKVADLTHSWIRETYGS